MPLFRNEALRGLDRLHGEVDLAPRVSWQAVGFFLASSIAAAITFLSFASYGSYIDAAGTITGSAGLAKITSPRDGMVSKLLVQEGQSVRSGQPLAVLNFTTISGGESLEKRRADAISLEQRALAGRAPALMQASRSRIAGLEAELSGEGSSQASLVEQIDQQQGLIKGAADDLERIRDVAAKGFISARDIRQREDLLATRRQDLSRLRRELSTSRSRSTALMADIARERDDLSLRLADDAASSATVGRAAAADENATTVTLVAPFDGNVSGLALHVGENLQGGAAAMYLIPHKGRLEATLEVPASRAAFITPKQPVRISVDAFPYQSFGTIEGSVLSMSLSSVPGKDPSAPANFMVKADLASEVITAYGRNQTLKPGMTIKARIRTRSRTLAEWIFDPLYAVARR